MADGHVGLAHIVSMVQVYLLAPVHQSKPMEAFNRVGSQPSPVVGHVVLRAGCHFL